MEVLFKDMSLTEAPMVRGAKEYKSNVYWGKQMTKILEENHLLSKIRLISHPLKTIFQHKACTDKLYADSFYKIQKNSHSSFEVICCRG